MLNLLIDTCFPVLRKDGTRQKIAFHQLTEDHQGNPIVAFQTPRRDFDAALMQLFIGLLQSALPPKNDLEWAQAYANPPSAEALAAAVAPLAPYFSLTGEGPCFMQDLLLTPQDGEIKPISNLLIEAPGGNTLKLNIDHFIKRGGVVKLSPFYAALALFTMNINAPSGGVGHRTSLRGGGPLTSLVMGDTLWQTLWNGVLDQRTFLGDLFPDQKDLPPGAYLPWCKATVVSKKKGTELFPVNTPLLHCYWGMPRRIVLAGIEEKQGTCDLSGEAGSRFFTGFVTQNYGNNYGDGWMHPLSPHYEDKKSGVFYCIKGQPDGLGWRHWAGLVFRSQDSGRTPAVSVQRYMDRCRLIGLKPGKTWMRLHVFGYDMDNMKARSWLDRVMPVVFPTQDKQQQQYGPCIIRMIELADHFASTLRQQYMLATSRLGKKAHGNFAFVKDRFWAESESIFTEHADALAGGADQHLQMEAYLVTLANFTVSLFDQLTAIRAIETANPEQTMSARRDLIRFISPRGAKIRKRAKLPLLEEVGK